jgi:hypothetical protein
MYIVKRITKPATDAIVTEYLAKGAKWIRNPSEARTFANTGHAKTALKSGLSYKRPARIGDEVLICEVVLHTKNAVRWIVS